MTHKLSEDQHQGKAMKLEEELKQCEEEQRNAATLLANGHHSMFVFQFVAGDEIFVTYTYTKNIMNQSNQPETCMVPPQRCLLCKRVGFSKTSKCYGQP